jgi:energy-converting hydrogenase Eha subunit E
MLAPGLAKPAQKDPLVGLEKQEMEAVTMSLQALTYPTIVLDKACGTDIHYQGDFAGVLGRAGELLKEGRQQA